MSAVLIVTRYLVRLTSVNQQCFEYAFHRTWSRTQRVYCFCVFSSDALSDPGEEDVPSEGLFEGHQEAVNGMQIHNGLLFTCSGDRTIRAFDLVVSLNTTTHTLHSS